MRTRRDPGESVVENIPNPPPFQGESCRVRASRTWLPATATSTRSGTIARHSPPEDKIRYSRTTTQDLPRGW